MPRHPLDPKARARREAEVAASATNDWARRKSAPSKRRLWDPKATQSALDEMIAAHAWHAALPKHFVELYARMHREVYGVDDLELVAGKARMLAAAQAGRALRDHFGGEPAALADFMRWVWQRQAREERQRKAGLREGDFRVTWRYQWSARLVTDYRRTELHR